MAIQNLFTSRDNNLDGNTYVGQLGRLWYNPDTNSIYASDGATVGGIPVDLATGANILANNIVANDIAVNTMTSRTGIIPIDGALSVTGNITFTGNISPAAAGKIGGITPGPGVVISTEGELTIDASGLPLSFGNFTANNNVLTIINADEDMILQTSGSAEIQLIGNIGFYKPDGLPPDLANRYFYATEDGTVHSKYLDIQSFGDTELAAPFNVTIDATGNYRPPTVLSGTIAQFTGNSGQRSFIVQDNYGIDTVSGQTGGEYTFRTGRGTVDTPIAVQANDRLASIVAAGWASNGYGGQASGYYRIVANENFTPTARGGRLEMWVVPNGTITETKIATIDGNGLVVIGTMSSTGNITGGNLLTTGNISSGSLSVTGNVTANSFVGNGAPLTSITGANVIGAVATATSLGVATSILAGRLTINPAVILKGTASVQTFTLTGLTTSHKILALSASQLTYGVTVSAAWPSAANTLSIEFQNVTSSDIDLANINIDYFAWI